MKGLFGSLFGPALLACAPQQRAAFADCGIQYRGAPSVVIRQSSGTGPFLVLVRIGTPNGAPVSDVRISLHADTLFHPINPALRSGLTDPQGRILFDSLVAGPYGLLVRQLGYDVLRQVVHLRSGFADTIDVRLRSWSGC
jgi:hypothetical protein